MMAARLRRPTTAILLLMGGLGAFGSWMEIRLLQGPARIPPDVAPYLFLAHLVAAVLSLGPSSWIFALPGIEQRLRGRRGPLFYYGLVALGSALGAAVLQAFWAYLGQASAGSPVWLIHWGFLFATNLVVVWFANRDANARAAVAEGKKYLNETFHRLESVQVMNRRAPSQRHTEVLGILEQRIATSLDSMIAELDELAACSPSEARTRVELLMPRLDLLREEEVRLLSHRLHPSIVDVGMVPAFHFLVDRFHPDLILELDLPFSTTCDPPPESRLLFYRCAEEALENVRSHAGVSRAALQWQEAAEGWIMTIRDEGRGFEPSRESHGLGLHMLAGRVESTGGAWSLDSAPQQGTTVEVRIPTPGSLPVGCKPMSPPETHA